MNYPRLPTMRVELNVPPSWTATAKPDLQPHTCDTCVHFLHSLYPSGQPGTCYGYISTQGVRLTQWASHGKHCKR